MTEESKPMLLTFKFMPQELKAEDGKDLEIWSKENNDCSLWLRKWPINGRSVLHAELSHSHLENEKDVEFRVNFKVKNHENEENCEKVFGVFTGADERYIPLIDMEKLQNGFVMNNIVTITATVLLSTEPKYGRWFLLDEKFNSELVWKPQNVNGAIPVVKELLLNFDIPITDYTAPILLKLSQYFDCPVEVQICEKYIIESESIDMMEKLRLAGEYQLERLNAYCLSKLNVAVDMASEDGEMANRAAMLLLDEKDGIIDNRIEYQYTVEENERDFRRNDDSLNDVVFVVDDMGFHANKQILQFESPKFEEMFKRKAKYYEIRETRPEDFNTFLRMIYQPSMKIRRDNCEGLLKLAHSNKVNFILKKYEDFILSSFDFELVDCAILAGKYGLKLLEAKCEEQIKSIDDLKELSRSDKFKQIDDTFLGKLTHFVLR